MVDLNNDSLPFPDNYFDAVFSKSVIEHIEDTEHYMRERNEMCFENRGVVLILMVPDWETQYMIFYQDPTHIHPYTKKSIDRLLNMCEFKNVQAEKFIQLLSVWNNRMMAGFSRVIRLTGPVKKVYKHKFIRFSRELMILGSGRK